MEEWLYKRSSALNRTSRPFGEQSVGPIQVPSSIRPRDHGSTLGVDGGSTKQSGPYSNSIGPLCKGDKPGKLGSYGEPTCGKSSGQGLNGGHFYLAQSTTTSGSGCMVQMNRWTL